MRLVNLEGRLQVSTPGGVDIAAASHGDYSGDPEEIYNRWAEFVAWFEEKKCSRSDGRWWHRSRPRLVAVAA